MVTIISILLKKVNIKDGNEYDFLYLIYSFILDFMICSLIFLTLQKYNII